MASERQIEANRRNAMLSTGPQSDDGKKTSSQNALKHGLTARQHVFLAQENREEFEELVRELIEEFDPAAGLQAQLVYQLATNLWRLERAGKLEAILLQDPNASSGRSTDTSVPVVPGEREWSWLRSWVIRNDVLGKLSRYEASLLRQMTVLLRELRESQAGE